MEYVGTKCYYSMLEVGGTKQDSGSNTDVTHENQCQYNEYIQVKKNLVTNNKREFDTYWSDANKSYDENYNGSQVLIENCNAQTLERYADFVMNGHFLTDFLSTETAEKIDRYEECPNCGKKFKPKGLRRHLFYCGKDAQLKACSICEKKFSNNKSLKKHENYCNNPEYFHCDSCSYNTKRKDSLILHIESVHSSVCRVACPKCGKTLKNRNTLSVHIYYCGKEPNFQCSSCPYKTKYKRDFILHSVKIHSKDVNSLKSSNEGLAIKKMRKVHLKNM